MRHREASHTVLRALASIFLSFLGFVSLGFGPPRLLDSDAPQRPLYQHQLTLLRYTKAPPLMGKAALIMDAATGTVVYEQNGFQRLPPASTTKIMTAILTLERGNLADTVIIKREYLPEDPVDESIMGLRAGDAVALEALLWGLLLPSGNDAARAIADHIGGTPERFVAMMNEKAAELKLKDTHFVNPIGLDAAGQYSSAYDLAVMARYALKNPTFAKMVATPRQTVLAGGRELTLFNSNELLRRPDLAAGVNGVKTGTTALAGDCLVASVTREGRSIIAVVLGTESRMWAAESVIDYAYDNFIWIPLRLPLSARLADAQSGSSDLSFFGGQPRWAMVPRWEAEYLRATTYLFAQSGPKRSFLPLGTVVYSLGGKPLTELGFYALAP